MPTLSNTIQMTRENTCLSVASGRIWSFDRGRKAPTCRRRSRHASRRLVTIKLAMQSRRNFIGKVAGGLAGSLAAGTVLGANERVRIGIIGAGDRGMQILRE